MQTSWAAASISRVPSWKEVVSVYEMVWARGAPRRASGVQDRQKALRHRCRVRVESDPWRKIGVMLVATMIGWAARWGGVVVVVAVVTVVMVEVPIG